MSEPVLSVRDLRVAVQGFEAVRGVSFAVSPGEVVALVGGSGAGKSLTAKAVLGLLPHRSETGGSVRVADGSGLGYVPQEALTVLSPVHRVGDQIAAAIASVRGLGRAEARRAAVSALEEVGVPEPERRSRDFPHQFSGGMRQRAVIAMATVGAPGLIVADEPTAALDAGTQRRIMDLLKERCDRTGAAMLLITHDPGVVGEYADRVLTMSDGRLVETRAPRAAVARPRRILGGAEPVLEVEDLVVAYGSHRAVDGVSFSVRAGETLAMVGASGSGKSSTASAVLQLRRPESGSVRFEGRELTGLGERELRRVRPRIQPVLQDPYGSLSPRLTAGRAVAEPLRVRGRWDGRTGPARVAELLELVGLETELGRRYPHELSGGQCQRVNIARALAGDPGLLVLDEPTSALDADLRDGVIELLVDLQDRLGLAYLFICHDPRLVESFAHRVAVMEAGAIAYVHHPARDRT
ncbi:ABC transporter ATP-binding protein [Glycomyces albus]